MKLIVILGITFLPFTLLSQYKYEPSDKNPFGSLNPEAPSQVGDYAPMIGTCKCKSISRINQTTWADTVMMDWTFKYIMNGKAVQDLTVKEDGAHSGSIRQYNADSARWYVHYFASATPTSSLSTWEGNTNENGDIVLYRDQPAPNGTEGFFKITFSEISNLGFNWTGEWINKLETFSYPTWKIFCIRKR